MIRLTVDRGNTSTRTLAWDNEECVGEYISRPGDPLDLLAEFIESWQRAPLILSSVRGEDADFISFVSRRVCRFLLFDSSVKVPLEIDYKTPDTLGSDRIAAAVGTSRLLPGETCLIADCGTALTLDVLERGRIFRGGNISPGSGLRLKALEAFTSLPAVSVQGDVPEFGFDTPTAIRAGAVRGTALEISAGFELAKKLFGASRLMMTGGESELLHPLLALESSLIVIDERLVSIGLRCILDFNLK